MQSIPKHMKNFKHDLIKTESLIPCFLIFSSALRFDISARNFFISHLQLNYSREISRKICSNPIKTYSEYQILFMQSIPKHMKNIKYDLIKTESLIPCFLIFSSALRFDISARKLLLNHSKRAKNCKASTLFAYIFTAFCFTALV